MNCIEIISSYYDVAIRRSETFQRKIIPTCFQIICEVDQYNKEDLLNNFELENISKIEPCFVVSDSVLKLSNTLTAKFLFPHFMPFIIEGLQSNKVGAIYASYLCLGALARGSGEHFRNELDQLMSLMLPGLGFQDERIVFISLLTISLFAVEFSVIAKIINY